MEIVYYTVRPGNTLSGIAQFFTTSVYDILRYNNIPDENRIYAGQTLAIPAGSAAPAKSHVVRPGESLWSIAQIHSTTIDRLLELNDLKNPNILYPGQILTVS